MRQAILDQRTRMQARRGQPLVLVSHDAAAVLPVAVATWVQAVLGGG
jgi:hypothetical protein